MLQRYIMYKHGINMFLNTICPSKVRVATKSDMDWIPTYPYLYLFCLTNMDMDIICVQKFISIFILNRQENKSNTKSMNINTDIK